MTMPAKTLELADQAFDAFLFVRHVKPKQDAAGGIEYAKGVRFARPVDAGKSTNAKSWTGSLLLE